MNELTEQQKEKALKRFVYCQEYYKKYQPEHKKKCIQNTNKYINKIKSNPEKFEEYKNKKKNIMKELERKNMRSYAKRNEL